MAEHTSITTDAAGRRVMAKSAGTAQEVLRLEREADLLEAARHPGVVELIGLDGHGVGSILLTTHVDGPTLAQSGRLPLEESAGLLAALAATVADLHDLGLVHGAISPDHVIVGSAGRPVLCGLAHGGRTGQLVGPPPVLPRAFADPARDDAGLFATASDVFGLGALAHFLAPDSPAGHAMARVASQAMSEDVSARPSARALAEMLQQEVPSARLPRGLSSPQPVHPARSATDPLAALRRDGGGLGSRRPVRPRAGLLVASVAAVGVVGAALVLAGSSRSPAPTVTTPLGAPAAAPEADPVPHEVRPGPTTTRAGSASSSTSIVPHTRPSATVVARPGGCPPATAILQADVDADGCPDSLRYADGVLEAGDVRWAIGQAGDQVATGDWACQGARTLALFRPGTGEVFYFDGWAGPGRDLQAKVGARVVGGQALRAADLDRDGCHEAVVERATGAAEVLRLPRARP